MYVNVSTRNEGDINMRKIIKVLVVAFMLIYIPMLSGASVEISNHERMSDYYGLQVEVDNEQVYLKSNDIWMNSHDYIRNRVTQREDKEPNENANDHSRNNCNNRNGNKNVTDHDGNKCDEDDIPVPINPLVGIGFATFAFAVAKFSLLA